MGKPILKTERKYLVVFAALMVVALIAATQLTIRTGEFTFQNWFSLWIIQILIWTVWGLLTPVIFKFSGLVSSYKSRWRIFLVHTPISILVILLFLSLYTEIFIFFTGADQGSFFPTLMGLVVSSFHWFLILYWITVGAEYYLGIEDQYKEQELLNLQLESQLTDAQLKALKMQLNPHFLFNSLNTISGLVRSGDEKKAIGMLARLSDFLREVLIDRTSREITLASEIEFIKKYLEIEQLRFGSKLDVTIDTPENLDECIVPSLILQPIVENAIKHGISKKKNAHILKIKIWSEEKGLHISVYNDGPELTIGESKGVGVQNTIKRLEQSYKENHTFEIGNKDNGVEVKMVIPLTQIKTNIE